VDCVLNLAAGLDARPFRLALPRSLRWIDVDFAPILAYKDQVLRHARAACTYESVAADLTDAEARRALFTRVASINTRVLVVAEGLLIYLAPADVEALGADLHQHAPFASWLIDLASPQLLKWMKRSWGQKAEEGNAPFRFAPPEGTAFFNRCGWREREFRSMWADATRLNRRMPGAWIWSLFSLLQTRKQRAVAERFSGMVLLDRA
jgi:O-methyltransferase involved in polyketide biosynthesis